jgi:hypothetical protein
MKDFIKYTFLAAIFVLGSSVSAFAAEGTAPSKSAKDKGSQDSAIDVPTPQPDVSTLILAPAPSARQKPASTDGKKFRRPVGKIITPGGASRTTAVRQIRSREFQQLAPRQIPPREVAALVA